MIRSNWRESVDQVERGLNECLNALNRYEQQFHSVLKTEPTPLQQTSHLAEGRVTGWAERLATAGERAASVERLLAEQEEVWERWQLAVGKWKESLQQFPADRSAGG